MYVYMRHDVDHQQDEDQGPAEGAHGGDDAGHQQPQLLVTILTLLITGIIVIAAPNYKYPNYNDHHYTNRRSSFIIVMIIVISITSD